MNEKLKIKVTIADRVYPLTIKSEEEEGVRVAVKDINELIKNFEKKYAVEDKQDVLAMCALQFASNKEVGKISGNLVIKNAENKLRNLTKLIDSHLKVL